MSRPGVVAASALTRTFGPLTAVCGLDFQVEPGELFGIVGPDGAGKTTTLRMFAGVLPPSSGSLVIDGVRVPGSGGGGGMPSLAYMAQRFGLYEDLTVAENLRFYADLYRVPVPDRSSRLDRLYRFSRLGEFQGRLAGRLSGGMKQKLALSCSLIHSPRVLLLDEPTFGVDPVSRRELWLILEEMVAEGVTVVLSTSYLEEAERCNRVALLHQGRILALDRPEKIQASLDGAMVALRADRPRAARDVLRRTPGVRSASLFGDSVHVLIEPGAEKRVLEEAVRAAGLDVRSSEPIQPSLEDVFIDLVQAAA